MRPSSWVVGTILTVLALVILRLLYHHSPTVKGSSKLFGTAQNVTVERSDSATSKKSDVQDQLLQNTQAEISVEATQSDSQLERYHFHDSCPCHRTAPSLFKLQDHLNVSTLEQHGAPWRPAPGSYVGNSTCDRHSTLWKPTLVLFWGSFKIWDQVQLCPGSGAEGALLHLLHPVGQLWRKLLHGVEERSPKWPIQYKVCCPMSNVMIKNVDFLHLM